MHICACVFRGGKGRCPNPKQPSKKNKRAKINVTWIYLKVIVQLCYNIVSEEVGESVENRESNRLKYRSGSGSGSRNFVFNGSVPVQVQDFSKIWVQVRFGFSCTKI